MMAFRRARLASVTQQRILDLSIATEQKLFPNTADAMEEELWQAFERKREKNFCSIEAKAVLEQPPQWALPP